MGEIVDALKEQTRKLEDRKDWLKTQIEKDEWNLIYRKRELEETEKEIYSFKHTIETLGRMEKDEP